jgi:glutathione synthase
MNFLFLMDPLETVIYEKDTSFKLMLESHKRGNNVYYLPSGGIGKNGGSFIFHVTRVIPKDDKNNLFSGHKEIILNEKNVNAIFIRTDPPFNEKYLLNTWLLDLLPKNILVINNPSGIRAVNEKIWATQFTSLIPDTLISRNEKDIFDFLSKEKNIIGKPTDGFGGQSVFRIRQDDSNARVILEMLTTKWTREIILQRFIDASDNGDKRVLLLNGDPLGAVMRIHTEGDHRNNFFSGGKPVKTQINERDKKIIEALKPHLQKLGLYFVGIDIIGDYLIEVNVTSPTCLQEINRLNNVKLEERIIDFAEKLLIKNN